MSLFGNKVICNKCNNKFNPNKITHINGVTYCKSCADDEGKIICNKCNNKFGPIQITHIDGISYCKGCINSVIKEKERKRATVTPEQIKNIIISTTNDLLGYEITEYRDPITVQVVMGVDAWRDLLGSLRSFWGGRSKSLERELTSGYAFAIDDMKREACLRGADAVIGAEFDASLEVAGELGKSNDKIVIVGGVGTAVRLKRVKYASSEETKSQYEMVS